MSHTCKNGSHLRKYVTLENGSHVEKWITLSTMGHTSKNVPHLKKMGHTWKNVSHLKKWVTLRTMIIVTFLDVSFLFTIRNCQIVHLRPSSQHRINHEFMFLCSYWQREQGLERYPPRRNHHTVPWPHCAPVTQWPTAQWPTTQGPTTQWPTSQWPTSQWPTIQWSTIQWPTTQWPWK